MRKSNPLSFPIFVLVFGAGVSVAFGIYMIILCAIAFYAQCDKGLKLLRSAWHTGQITRSGSPMLSRSALEATRIRERRSPSSNQAIVAQSLPANSLPQRAATQPLARSQ